VTAPRGPSCPAPVLLTLRQIGLLDDEEVRSVDQHAATCAWCEGVLCSLHRGADMPATTADLGHIPASLLARLPAAREALPPQAQGAVDRHFEQCAACREERALLVRLRTHAPRTAARQAKGVSRHRRASSLWLGGYAVLATAAAVVLALRGPLSTRPAEETSPGTTLAPPAGAPAPDRPAAGAVPPAREPRATAGPASPAWSLRLVPRTPRPLVPLTRAGDPGTVLRRTGDPGALLVRIEPLLPIADRDPVAIELLDRNERVLATATAPWRDLHGGREILLTTGSGTLPAGSYLLRVRPAGPGRADGAAESVDHPFEISGER
jgi:hypothetical protein